MAILFRCPYLQADVELTNEREAHIVQRHPDLQPDYLARIESTLAFPDSVHVERASTLVFARWYDDLYAGKYFFVFVVRHIEGVVRFWVVTARLSRLAARGEVVWRRS